MHTIGIIGSLGDLGSQLSRRAKRHGFRVVEFDITDPHTSFDDITAADIIHICAPLDALKLPPLSGLIILHDSVMNTSSEYNKSALRAQAAVVHLLMNRADTAIVAHDESHANEAVAHLTTLGFTPRTMMVSEHDHIMAISQAPLALLCELLLPKLFELDEQHLLTPSGETLAHTLHSRTLVWTPTTRRAILRNPQLPAVIQKLDDVISSN